MDPRDKPRGTLAALLAVVLLAGMAVLAGGAALGESVTVDEVSHIGAGVSYLERLDLRLNSEHPPLPKVLAAIPLVIRGVRADYTHISWSISEKFSPAYLGQWVFGEWLLERWNDPKTLLAWARLPMLLLTLALGCAVLLLARRLGGSWGGLLCLTVYVSTPAFLAFGPLVHTDVASTLFSLLALWTFASLWREPTRGSVLLFGLSLAGALLSKFTAGVLFFAFAVFVLSLLFGRVPGTPESKTEARSWRSARLRATLVGTLCAALIVYLFYLVFSWHQPSDALYRLGTGPLALFFRRLLLPPVLYLRGVFVVLLTGRKPTFILGQSYPHSVWFYFPVVFALKSPLGFLLLLPLSLLIALRRRWRRSGSLSAIPPQFAMHWRVLWVSLLVFTGTCMLSPADISIRHFAVPLVLLVMLLAPVPWMLGELRGPGRSGLSVGGVVVALLAASCLYTAVRAYPYYLPFINSLSLGHSAYELVNDSNVDWNQSLPQLERFVEEHRLQKIAVDEYGFSDPTVFVPRAHVWNCQTPSREDSGQWVALSANMILDGHNCAWLMQYPHEALAGGSMYAVHLYAQIPPAGRPGGPPLPSSFRQFAGAPFDIQGLFRHLYQHPNDLPRAMEWMQATYPSASKSPGPPPKFPWER
ncbi:MAG TPA: glycosyltransferase family 39 protein [Candidatus Acidoferrum sp.]|nr:glycosyltransferase family 39 protein [Candidatus Acidoferrum sp.]